MAFLGIKYRGIIGSGAALGMSGIKLSSSTYQPESVAYFTAIEDAGGTLTDNVKAEFDAFVLREKDANRWDKLKRLYPFLGGKINSAIIDAVTTNAATNNNFVDGDVDSLIGIYPDGSTKYMLSDTPYQIWSNDNIFQIGTFLKGSSDAQAAINPYVAGVLQTSPSTNYLGLNRVTNSTNWNGKAGGTGNLPNVSLTGVDETVSILRFSSTSAYMMANQTESAQYTVTNTTVLQDNYQMRLFAASVNNATLNYTSQDINSIYFSEFTDLQEVKDFESSYKTFVNNITAYAATQAYFSAVTASGGTLTDNVKAEFTSFVSREVEAGRWSKIKRLYPFLGGKIASAVIDAVTTNAATNNNFVDADVDSLIGLTGDGSTKRIDTSLAADIWSDTNDWQIYYYEIIAESADKQVIGAISGGNDMVAIRRRNISTGNSYIYGNNAAIAVTIGGGYSSQQSVFGGRFSSTDLTIYQDTTSATNTTANTYAFPITYPISLLARNGSTVQYSDGKSGCAMMAEGMSKTDMQGFDDSYKTFINNIKAYAASQAYFSAVESAGGTLTDNVKAEFTSFVSREVDAGRWSKYKAVYPMIGGNLASVKINVVNPGTYDLTLANFVEADVDAICGLQSDGSTKHAQIQGGTLSNLAGGYSLQFADYAITLNASPSRGVYNQGLIDSSYFITHRWRSNITPNREYVYAGASSAGVTAVSNIQLSGDSFVSCINGNASTTTAIAIRNGVTAASNSFATVSQMTLSNEEWALFALNNNSVIQAYQDMNAAGFWIATELSESEAISADISYKTFINNITA